MALSTRPGEVLAGRYRLIDLLSESGGGRFWRAHDRVLERYVALHVIAEDDPRAPGLIDAARASAMVLDPRILRVLDAETEDGKCYVVNEWGTGTSLDLLLANHGPLGPRRSAWLVADVAGAVQQAHTVGVAHGRLNPENVLIDRFGSVRLIGLCVDAALHGLPGDRFTTDLGDLGGLLHASLTGAWPGPSSSLVPAAPRTPEGMMLSPRQVRAGVPKQLDDLWRAISEATDPARHRRRGLLRSPLTTQIDVANAHAISTALLDFVGDPSGLPAALAASVLPINQIRPVDLPAVSDPMVHDVDPDPEPPVVEPEPDPDPEPAAADEAAPETREPDDSIPLVTELPTEAGLPVFGDDGDVEWLRARSTPPPPPPPFEEPPERPLFAPDPPDGAPVRRPRTDVPTPTTVGLADRDHPLDRSFPTGEITGFWPWDHDAELARAESADADEVPGRSWLRLAMSVLVAMLLLFAIVIAFNLGRGRTPLGSVPDHKPKATHSAAAGTVTGLKATSFDPLGDGEENPEDVAALLDGNRATTWNTSTYAQQLGPHGLKTGVGILLDLGSTRTVADVQVQLIGDPTAASLYLSAEKPTGAPTGAPAAHATSSGGTLRLTPATDSSSTTGRYALIWLTGLPHVSDGFRATLTEVTVHAR
ncbi:protein kinase family protein [Nocardioides montaniterrae]